MSPATHLLASGVLAGLSDLDRRGRTAVVLAGIIPDLDGLGYMPELMTRHSAHQLLWFSNFHHQLHTLAFSVLVATFAALICKRRLEMFLFALASFHLHLVCDLIGARGPDGYQWPIPYLSPFTHDHSWIWAHQWPLNAWPNFALTCGLIITCLWMATVQGHSLVEIVSVAADNKFIAALRARFKPVAR